MFKQFKANCILFTDFIRNPAHVNKKPLSQWDKLKTYSILLLIDLFIIIIFKIILVELEKIEIISLKEHKINILFENYSTLVSIILLVLVTPLLEELVFRLHLRLNTKFIHYNILIIVAGVIILLLPAIKLFYLRVTIISAGLILILLYFLNKSRNDKMIFEIWSRNYFYVFYISLLIFGILHITNYSKGLFTYILLPLLVLPQVIMGFFCSYIRLQYNFFWGYVFHSSHNFILAIPIMMVALIQGPYKNSVEIVEHDSLNKRNYSKISNDTIKFDRRSIYNIMPDLLDVGENEIEYADPEIAGKILTVRFYREGSKPKGLLKSSKSIVLFELLKKFNLKIERKTFEKPIYHLQITDPVKLSLHVDYEKDSLVKNQYPVWFYDSINLKNVSLKFIAQTIRLNYEQKVIDTLKNNKKYTMMIPKLEIEELNKFITKQYGIKLEKSFYKVPGFRISSIN